MYSKHIIRISLLVILAIITFFVYKFNKYQLDKKKEVVEKFLEQNNVSASEIQEDPEPFSEKDFNIYANIIGIYKHSTGKSPNKENLFTCYKKVKENELTYAQLNNELHKNKQFKCTDTARPLRDEQEDDLELMSTINKKKDEELISEDEKLIEDNQIESDNEATGVLDKNSNIQYIINRPTIYNIGSQEKITKKKSKNKSKKEISEDQSKNKDTNTSDEDEDEKIKDQMIKEDPSINRCDNEEEVKALANLTEKRNMDRLHFGCQNNKNMKNVVSNFTNEVQPSANDKKNKKSKKKQGKVEGWSYESSDLLGTSIDLADNTSVGSIMPHFRYEEQSALF